MDHRLMAFARERRDENFNSEISSMCEVNQLRGIDRFKGIDWINAQIRYGAKSPVTRRTKTDGSAWLDDINLGAFSETDSA